MFSTNYKVALQVSEAIYLLSKKEFPERWRVLASNLASVLKGNENMYEQELIALKTMLKIFKKYFFFFEEDFIFERYEYSERSDPLYEEIILVCNETHDIFLNYVQTLLTKLYSPAESSGSNLHTLKLLKTSLKIFYCLNFQVFL